MAAVTGPISTLPGSHHLVPAGQTCDDCNEPAVKRIQGETDSFGSEMFDFCQACYDKWQAACAEPEYNSSIGMCDWCGQHATNLRPHRDFEEGSCGPVYNVCGTCIQRENKALEQECWDNE